MGPVGVKSDRRGARLRAGLGAAVGRVGALAGAPGAWLLLLLGWALTSAGAWQQFGPGWAGLLGGALLIGFAVTLVDVDRSRR